MNFTKADIQIFKHGCTVAYRNVSNGLYGGIGTIVKAEMYSEDEEAEFNGIRLTIKMSDSRTITRDAEEIILLS